MGPYIPNQGHSLPQADSGGGQSRRGDFVQSSDLPQFTDRERAMNVEYSQQRPMQKPSRKRNRNSLAGQIRSLEKLLKHPGTKMSQVVRQEKGRELAALVLARERKKATLRAKKNLGKYHKVRFIERQKCERVLKALRKALMQAQEARTQREQRSGRNNIEPDIEIDTDMEDDGGVHLPSVDEKDIEEQIKQAEVDLNYTIYAPLGEKYISLFPPTGKEKLAGMSGVSKDHLQPQELEEIRRLHDDNVVRNATGEKPPMWEKVRELMEKGAPLDQLRDGKLTSSPVTLPQVGGKKKAVMQPSQPAPAWMADDGLIAAEDQDSDDSDFFE